MNRPLFDELKDLGIALLNSPPGGRLAVPYGEPTEIPADLEGVTVTINIEE